MMCEALRFARWPGAVRVELNSQHFWARGPLARACLVLLVAWGLGWSVGFWEALGAMGGSARLWEAITV